MEKSLPANIDAERATLGSILLNREAIVAIAPWLSTAAFYLEKHVWIYEAMLACYNARVPPDTRTVSDELRRQDRLDPIGGIPTWPIWSTLSRPRITSNTTPGSSSAPRCCAS